MSISDKKLRFALVVLCVIAGLKFLARGPAMSFSRSTDLLGLYLPARAWILHQNYYDVPTLERIWHHERGIADPAYNPDAEPPVYLPTAVALISPIAHLSWAPARSVWMLLNCLSLVAVIWSAHRLPGSVCSSMESLCLIAGRLPCGRPQPR